MNFECQFQYVNRKSGSIKRIYTVFKRGKTAKVVVNDFVNCISTENIREFTMPFVQLTGDVRARTVEGLDFLHREYTELLTMPNGVNYDLKNAIVERDYRILRVMNDSRHYF